MEKFNLKKNWWKFLLLFLLPLIITGWVLLVINFSWIDLSDKNNIGDALGGITSPIIGIGGIILTFLAFYIQYQFNVKQNELIKEQRKQYHIDKFDNRFNESLKIQLDNVKEFNINNKFHSRKTFVYMYKELEFIDAIVINEFIKFKKRNAQKGLDDSLIDKLNLMNISYSIFYHGLFYQESVLDLKNVNKMERSYLGYLINKLYHIQNEYSDNKNEDGTYEYTISTGNIYDISFYPLMVTPID